MSQPLYRDYSNWLTAMEPKLQWVHLTRPQFRRLAALVGACFTFAALLLVSRIAVIKNGYAIVELRQERDQLQSQKRQLQRHMKLLQSLSYAEEVARRDLGMGDISPNSVIHLDDPALGAPRRAWAKLFGG